MGHCSVYFDGTVAGGGAPPAPTPPPAPTYTPQSPGGGVPDETNGAAYSAQLTTSGGSGGTTYAIVAGRLPAGIGMNSAGTFYGSSTETGVFSFTVRRTDNTGHAIDTGYAFSVSAPPDPYPVGTTLYNLPTSSNVNQDWAGAYGQVLNGRLNVSAVANYLIVDMPSGTNGQTWQVTSYYYSIYSGSTDAVTRLS